jgi:hypothetical protein
VTTLKERLDALTPAMLKRLLIVAQHMMGRRSWRGEASGLGAPADGTTPEDIVSSCVEQLLTHPDKWKPDRGSFFKYMSLLISSEVSRIHKKRENLVSVRMDTLISDNDIEFSHLPSVDASMPGLSFNQLCYPADQEDEITFAELVRDIRKQTWSSDTRLVLDAMINDTITKPEILARKLNIPIKRVYAIKAELRRKLRGLLPENALALAGEE